jgi:hypothetical protein
VAEIFHKFFTTGGPADPLRHYVVPAVERVPYIRQLVEDGLFFALRGPRQSGKTTLIQELVREINDCDRFHALYISLGEARILRKLASVSSFFVEALNEALKASPNSILSGATARLDPNPIKAVRGALVALCSSLDKPLALFIDEFDSLRGEIAKSLLDQFRVGHATRARSHFPYSLGLISTLSLDNLPAGEGKARRGRGSAPELWGGPFFVARELRLPNFSFADINKYLELHSVATGQSIEDAARARVWHWTAGQPWLVNALMTEAVELILNGDWSKEVSPAVVDQAAEALKREMPTHLRRLMAWIKEPQVRTVMGPVLAGSIAREPILDEGVSLALDLGLLSVDNRDNLRPANQLYQDIALRALTEHVVLPASLEGRFLEEDALALTPLLQEFQRYWREKSLAWLAPFAGDPTVLAHLAVQLFLRACLAGQGELQRRSAIGEDSLDLTVSYRDRKYPITLKVARPGALAAGLDALSSNLDAEGALEGWLLLFDMDNLKSPEEKISWKTKTLSAGRAVQVVGL